MFLNNLGEPVAVDEFESQNLDLSAPLLIAYPNLSVNTIPESWTGTIYTTRSVINGLLLKYEDMHKFVVEKRFGELKENETLELRLPDNSCVFITPIAWSKGKQEPKLIFLIKDKYLTRICVDVLSNTLSPIILNNSLRKSIQDGIDIVHFNDSFAKGMNPRDSKVQHTWLRLHLLIYLMRPKELYGLYDTTPPKYISQCCSKPGNGFVYLKSHLN